MKTTIVIIGINIFVMGGVFTFLQAQQISKKGSISMTFHEGGKKTADKNTRFNVRQKGNQVNWNNEQRQGPRKTRKHMDVYEIKHGDSLKSIAKKMYGDPEMWKNIYQANSQLFQSSEELPIGETLVIP